MLERVLAAPRLTSAEHRLVLAIARETLGWRRRRARIGERRLRKLASLDGRTLERAREGLVEAGLVKFTPGRPGRGNAAQYELILDGEMPALTRAFSADVKARSHGTKKPALARAHIGSKGKTTQQTLSIETKTVEAYLAAGGSLELAEWRGALARSAAGLAKRGTSETLILAAARQLGRERAFPGYLKQRAEQLEAEGGACSWHGLDRSRLTAAQLSECECARCAEWLAFATATASA